MKKYGLLGYPLGHSLSPQIHRRLFALSGIEASYDLLPLPPERLHEFCHIAKAYDGFNVTIPYKEQILSHCVSLDRLARAYGAVNTITKERVGYNTDGAGFLKATEGYPLGGDVLILGAGGAARVFAYESAQAGAKITLAVRESSKEKAKALRQELMAKFVCPVRILPLDALEQDRQNYRWLLQATSVGMQPNSDQMPVSSSVLSRCEHVFDAVYRPRETKLLREAKACGCRVFDGMKMLVWQAVRAHEIWYNAKFCESDLQALWQEMDAWEI